MNKKWFLLLASLMLSALMVAGCGANDDPAPPANENQEQAPLEDDLQDAEENMEEPFEDAEQNMEGTEENMEEPFEDPDNDGNDEMDPNPAED
ncbi:hypothetical protein SAMN05192533_103205 [Mesobacillus persicus]|uniref:Uncharacterized protein n=1 Tax=Mesobacillus persicus TaxID=930146 RepID=A0A1H7YZL7_9BACI|nr:hypothetical protein [Mesobacillus persicus]SEM51453.1 hypothetical protein SAMN05192533_103205 [Mesobacillus persicus]